MNRKYVYITDPLWFESTSLKNPISLLDHDLSIFYPEFYELNYDLKILSTQAVSEEEKSMPGYNDYREKYGSSNISVIDAVVAFSAAKKVFLNGFHQEQFEYISPLIKETTEFLYLFKCKKIKDLSPLSEFKNLKGVFIFANTELKSLWDMKYNDNLKILSFVYVTKLQNIEFLTSSNIEYINFDSSNLFGNKGEMLFDKSVFTTMPNLKHLFLSYKRR